METSRRTQLLKDSEEFKQLRPADRKALVDAILDLKLPRIDWKNAEKEIEAGHASLS